MLRVLLRIGKRTLGHRIWVCGGKKLVMRSGSSIQSDFLSQNYSNNLKKTKQKTSKQKIKKKKKTRQRVEQKKTNKKKLNTGRSSWSIAGKFFSSFYWASFFVNAGVRSDFPRIQAVLPTTKCCSNSIFLSLFGSLASYNWMQVPILFWGDQLLTVHTRFYVTR